MSESGKRIFASAGISSSLDTVLATTLGTNYHNRLSNYKKSSSNLISEKSLSNDSSKSSSGSSLTLTNNNTNSNSITTSTQYPHHQFYSQQSQISTSQNSWNVKSSVCSQKVSNLILQPIERFSNNKFRSPTMTTANDWNRFPLYWH